MDEGDPMVWPHPRDVNYTPDQVTIMIICLLYAFFLTFFLILKPVLAFNPVKLREHLP